MEDKETLEKSIEQELENHFFSNISEIKQAKYFINFGIKLQQEQNKKIYSEEEVYNILEQAMKDDSIEGLTYHYNGDFRNLKEWFKKFKKK